MFKNKSYVCTEDFDFGINLIIKDVSKLCSLKIEEVELLLKKINLESLILNDAESYLDNSYFSISPYRKIKHQLILDIIVARLDEFMEVCYEKNNNAIYINIGKSEYFKNIQFALRKNKFIDPKLVFGKNNEDSSLSSLNGAAELIGKGWEKEAIPVTQSKKSLISSLFSRLFS